MELKLLMKTARMAVIEICDGNKFETENEFTIRVNGETYMTTGRTVVSVYGLEPNTDNVVTVIREHSTEELHFHTDLETVTLDVKAFGAKGDGVSNDTPFIQAAISSCPKGGRVVVPAGVYKIYPIFLRSHITFEIQKDAVLSAFTDRENFPILPGNVPSNDEKGEYFLGTWEGEPAPMFAGIITAVKVKDTTVCGEGTIDGCASEENWWFEPKKIRIATRPRMIFFDQCKDMRVQGITVKNSPSWNLHPYFSKDLGFYDLKIISPKISPNTDGLNPESCKNVNIVGVYFSVGDDCIAIKSGKIYMGAKYKTPSKGLSIRKCRMQDGHGAIVIGSENAGGVKDLLVEDCEFKNTDRGLRIKTRRGRGKDAVVDGVTFNRIDMDHVMTPVVINEFYFCDPDGHSDYVQTKEALEVDERTPELGDFLFKDIKATNCHVAASYIYGLPEKKVKSVRFENVDISFTDEPVAGVPAMMDGVDPMTRCGLFAKNVENLELENVTVTGQEGQAFIIEQ